MKALGIVGSPRKKGNTDILVSQILDGLKSKEVETEKVYLGDLKIEPCNSCYQCMAEPAGKCVLKDDMSASLYDKVEKADVLVLGSPIYFYGPTAQLKAFIDRLFAFIEPDFSVPKLKGKKVLLATPYGEPNPSASIALIHIVDKACQFTGMQLLGAVQAPGAMEKGDVNKQKAILDTAFALGQQAASA